MCGELHPRSYVVHGEQHALQVVLQLNERQSLLLALLNQYGGLASVRAGQYSTEPSDWGEDRFEIFLFNSFNNLQEFGE